MAAKCSRRAVDGSTIGPVAPDAWRRRVCGRVRALSAPASAACAANWGQPKLRPPPPINAPNFSLTCYRRKPLIGNAAPRRICTKIMRVSSGNSARKPSTSDARWCLKHAITTQAGRRDESLSPLLSSLRPAWVFMACVRHQRASEGLGLLAELPELTLLIFVQLRLGAAFPIGGFLL